MRATTISKLLFASIILTSSRIASMQKEKSERKKENTQLEIGAVVTEDFIKKYVKFSQKIFIPCEKVIIYSNTKQHYVVAEIKFWHPDSTPEKPYFTVHMGYGIKDVPLELIGKIIQQK